MELTPWLQKDPNLFNKLYITSPLSGKQVPLSSFVTVDTSKTGYLSINHQGQFPAVTISFNMAPGVALGQAVTAIQTAQASMNLTQTLCRSLQGTATARSETRRDGKGGDSKFISR